MRNSGISQKPSLSFVCPEDWNSMSPCGQGRFCGSCQKTVLDFTQKSDAEIQAMLANREGEVCGRFYAHQLAQPVNSRFSFRKIFSSVLVLLGLSLLSREAVAQELNKPFQKENTVKPDSSETFVLGKLNESIPVYKNGGQEGLRKFLALTLKYPSADTEGKVVASFIVDEKGKVTEPKIVRSLSPEADKEVLRVVQLLAFIPGERNGKAVPVQYTLPVRFGKE
jgi:TonB family protein